MKAPRTNLIPTRRSLLARLKNPADNVSWQQFYDTYRDLLYSVGIKAGLNDAEAKDVVQETVISVSRKMEGFEYDPEKASFKGWLLKLAYWRVQDQLRKRKHQGVPLTPPAGSTEQTPLAERIEDPGPTVLTQIVAAEWDQMVLRAALDRVRQQVNPKDFQIYDLHVLQQWTVGDVAKSLGTARAKIHLVKHRVGTRLKQEIHRVEAQLNKVPR